MNLGFIVLFGILLLSCIACIILFRNYKREHIMTLHKKDVPLRLLSGLSFYIADITLKGRKPRENKLLYAHRIRIISYIILMFLICNTFGFGYLISLEFDEISSIFMVSRPDVGEGDKSATIITDNDMYSGPLDITIEERQYTFEETIQLFDKYRAQLDAHILGENTSFSYVDSSLNFPSIIGDENIAVSWLIGDTDIIDYSGELHYENLSEAGSETDIIATLTLGDISADICYYIKAYPKEKDAKTMLQEYIENQINSPDNLYDDQVVLPIEIDGSQISYTEYRDSLPP